MQVEDQDAPIQDKLTGLEQKIGELAIPMAETSIVRAFGPKGEVYYAVQAFRYTAKPLDYYAIRLRKLGHIRYIGNRERPMYVSTMVVADRYASRENAVYAIVNSSKRFVSIGPKTNGGILDPEDRSMGLGAFAMSLVIRWLKTHYSDFRVAKCTLADVEENLDERERRDRFLAKMGFSVVYTGRQGKGYFYANHVGELQEHINTRKIEETGIDGLFTTFASMQEWHKELSNDFDALRKDREKQVSQVIPKLRRRSYVTSLVALLVGSILGAAACYLGVLQGWLSNSSTWPF